MDRFSQNASNQISSLKLDGIVSNKANAESVGSKPSSTTLNSTDSVSVNTTSSGDASMVCSTLTAKSATTSKQVSKTVSNTIVDKRVSLTVTPRNNIDTIDSYFASRVAEVLGSKTKSFGSNEKIYGFLYESLSPSSGLIFPYTPAISVSQSVNYTTQEMAHSNMAFNYYKNTPPTSYSINDATFSADNRDNALHMLSAIWFLTAVSKCEFGQGAVNRGRAGLAPPVLYLNGYDSLIDNVPVVVTSVSYNYPKDKHYVNLIIDLSKKGKDLVSVSEVEKEISKEPNVSVKQVDNPQFGSRIIEDLSNGSISKTTLSFWLPTTLSMNIGLKVQPNPIRTRVVYDLDDYKSGYLFLHPGESKVSQSLATETNIYKVDQCGNLTEKLGSADDPSVQELAKTMNTETKTSQVKATYNFNKFKTGWTW